MKRGCKSDIKLHMPVVQPFYVLRTQPVKTNFQRDVG